MTSSSDARVLRGGVATAPAFRSIVDLPPVGLHEVVPTGASGAIYQQARNAGLAAGRAEGFDAGRAEGFEVGRAEGLRAGAVEAADSLAGLGDAVRSAAHVLAQRDAVSLADISGTVVALAMEIASAVLDREVIAATDPGTEAIVRALALAPQRGAVIALVNPEDLALVVDPEAIAPGRELRLVADSSVRRGGCVLEVDACRIDGTIDSALARVAEVLAR